MLSTFACFVCAQQLHSAMKTQFCISSNLPILHLKLTVWRVNFLLCLVENVRGSKLNSFSFKNRLRFYLFYFFYFEHIIHQPSHLVCLFICRICLASLHIHNCIFNEIIAPLHVLISDELKLMERNWNQTLQLLFLAKEFRAIQLKSFLPYINTLFICLSLLFVHFHAFNLSAWIRLSQTSHNVRKRKQREIENIVAEHTLNILRVKPIMRA